MNAKILKDVKFPMTLDVFELCTKELQEKLIPARSAFKEKEDKELEKAANRKPGSGAGDTENTKKKVLPFAFPDGEDNFL